MKSNRIKLNEMQRTGIKWFYHN